MVTANQLLSLLQIIKVNTCGFELIEHVLILCTVEKISYRSRDLGTYIVNAGEIFFSGSDERIHAAELFGKGLCGALADVADAEAKQNAVEWRLLRALDLLQK